MSKLLSMFLAITLVMSLFCAVPVSAAEVTKGDYAFPYIYENFENGTSFFGTGGGHTSTIVDSGNAERGKVAQVTVSGGVNGGPSFTSVNDINTEISIGDTIKISAWIKSNVKLTSANLSIIFYPEINGVNTAYKQWSLPFDKNSTEWQHVTTTIVSDWSGTFYGGKHGTSLRFGTTGGLNFAQGETSSSSTITDRIYLVDDFELMISKPVESYGSTGKVLYQNDFSNNDLKGLTVTSTDCPITFKTTGGPATGYAGNTPSYLELADNNKLSHLYFKIPLGKSMEAGKKYLLRFQARVLSGEDWYEKDAANSLSATKVKDYGTEQTAKLRAIFHNAYSGYGYRFVEMTSTKITDTQWKALNCVYELNDASKATDTIVFDWWIRIQGAGCDLGVYNLANLEVIELDAVAYGDFENGTDHKYIKVSTETNTTMNGNTTNGDSATNYGWITEANSAVSYGLTQDTSIKNGRYYGKFAYTSNTTGNKISDKIELLPGRKYKISGKFKYENSASVAPLAVDIDWTSLTTNRTDTIGSVTGTAGTVNTFELSFETPEESELATGKVFAEGTLNFIHNDANLVAMSILVDDIKTELLPSIVLPTITELYAFGESEVNSEIELRYATSGAFEGDTDASIIKLLAGTNDANMKVIKVFKAGDDIVVPEAATGKQIKIEIIPYAATARLLGNAVSVMVLPKFDIDFQINPIEEGNASAKVLLTSNDPEGDKINAVIVLCTYDENGALIAFDAEPVICEGGSSSGTDYTFVTVTAIPGIAAKTAKAFLWDCGTESSPTAFNTTMDEIAPTLVETNS